MQDIAQNTIGMKKPTNKTCTPNPDTPIIDWENCHASYEVQLSTGQNTSK